MCMCNTNASALKDIVLYISYQKNDIFIIAHYNTYQKIKFHNQTKGDTVMKVYTKNKITICLSLHKQNI